MAADDTTLPFLDSQELLILKRDPKIDPREAMHPERFRDERMAAESERKDTIPWLELWEELNRNDLIAGTREGKPERLWVLTTDAGMGKTYNLVALHHELQHRPNLVFRFLIGDLEKIADNKRFFEDLVRKIIDSDPKLDRDKVRQALKKKQVAGQIYFLFDGLDQVSGTSAVKRLASLIALSDWQHCRFVVAGRPYAVEAHWDELFKQQARSWNYVQIREFTEAQQKEILEDRYEAIPEDARKLLTVPRVLEYVAKIPKEELPDLKTVSDVYWKATGYMLTKALKRKKLDPQEVQRYRAILGAFAFGMYKQTTIQEKQDDAELTPNIDRVPKENMLVFRSETFESVREALKKIKITNYQEVNFVKDCRKLSKLNALLNHGWLDTNEVGDTQQPLLWRNASLQEFFAAYFCSCWASSEDLEPLKQWNVDPLIDHNRAFYWYWRYATEMPDAVVRPGHTNENPIMPNTSWVNCMAPLYRSREIRSTELLYRSWDRMKGTAPQQVFLAEFPAIRKGEYGTDKKRIADEMMEGFITLCEGKLPGDTGTFLMGATKEKGEVPYDPDATSVEGPPHLVKLSCYRLHRYCVTNLEYELFNEVHWNHRWNLELRKAHPEVVKTGDPNADDRCPAVNISWYDAFIFAVWCGCALPTEAQWEYACRAGTQTPYSLEGYDGMTLPEEACNFDYNIGHTVAVDLFVRNRWGFYQMHGNVWERCWDWYSEEYYDKRHEEGEVSDPRSPGDNSEHMYRIVRAGSWNDNDRSCRSSYRYSDLPDTRYHFIGFRLSCMDFG